MLRLESNHQMDVIRDSADLQQRAPFAADNAANVFVDSLWIGEVMIGSRFLVLKTMW
jgi:hypothetical protein